MLACLKSFLTVTVLLVSVSLWAQEAHRGHDLQPLARLSYEKSTTSQEGSVRVCIAVSRDGSYQIVRSPKSGQTQRLQGKMPDDEFQHLKTLLESAEFRVLSQDHLGIIRRESERFGAEIPLPESRAEDGTKGSQRLQWLNADGASPFPVPIAKVVNWLKDFRPASGNQFDSAEYEDVCPSVGLRLLQPSVAANANH